MIKGFVPLLCTMLEAYLNALRGRAHVALVEILVAQVEILGAKNLSNSELVETWSQVYVDLFLLCMTRSSPGNLHAYDPEIDRTFYSTCASDPTNSADSNSDLGSSGVGFDFNFGVNNVENNDKTLKELATLVVMYQPWCIQYVELEQARPYELKSGLIHSLPKFHGLVGKDPYKHLKEFHVVCSTMRPHGILEDYIKMKAFPFSLDGVAKDWLYL
ncbi:hypothetical protein CR513_12488, partial [Mucuna pruriens]